MGEAPTPKKKPKLGARIVRALAAGFSVGFAMAVGIYFTVQGFNATTGANYSAAGIAGLVLGGVITSALAVELSKELEE